MKRSIEALVILEMLAVIVVMAVLGLCGSAHAEPAQQFAFQVRTPRPGILSARIELRSFDTTGAVPPTPTAWSVRLPRGVALDPAFLTSRYRCDGTALRDALDRHPSGMQFTQRITNLSPFIHELARSRAPRDRAALANARVCQRATVGVGSGKVDVRKAVPAIGDPVPVGFAIFLSRPTIPGGIAGFTILGAAEASAPIVRRYPVLAGVHAVITENLVSDPTPDGLYGDKLVLDTGPINGFQVSVAEADVTVHSLRLARGTCLARGHGGRCTRRQRTDASLFAVPRCPASGHFSAQLLTAYAPPLASLATTLQIPCPRYAA